MAGKNMTGPVMFLSSFCCHVSAVFRPVMFAVMFPAVFLQFSWDFLYPAKIAERSHKMVPKRRPRRLQDASEIKISRCNTT